MKKQSRLLEKIGLGMGSISLALTLYFATNIFLMDKAPVYKLLRETNSKILYVKEAKRSLQEADTYFCSENFKEELNKLYFKKREIKDSVEYKEWEKKKNKNYGYFGEGILAMASGAFLFFTQYVGRKFGEKEDKE